ncbi:MAG: hypothetical protein H0V09_09820, partial [Gemmatimonadetes bacterium]|nr:hypothetical protein [Gemmatimonadota bacterium]
MGSEEIDGVWQRGIKLKRLGFITSLLAILQVAILGAQEEHAHHPAANEQLGRVHFPISCSEAVRERFGQAVATLHSFWYEEAERTFTEVTREDPACGMGYWGIAMSLYHPLWEPPDTRALERGRAAVEKARSVAGGTARERDYIAAIEAFYRESDRLDHPTRALAYEKAMARVHARYPEDREAALFYALAVRANAPPSDKTYARQKRAAELLGDVLAEQPDHPGVAHYLIHAYDHPGLASLALDAARRYSRIAPAVPHALHMPSHIFTRLGLWRESIDSNLATVAAAKEYARRTGMQGVWSEQLHAMDYLTYAYLQRGQDREAERVLADLREIRQAAQPAQAAAYALAAIPARYALEKRDWASAVSLAPSPPEFPWGKYAWAEAITVFARALGAARTGEPAVARGEIERLAALRDELRGARDEYWADQVEIQRLAAAGWLAQAEGKREEALQLMRGAADLEDATDKHPVTPGPILPARELLG